MHETTKSTPRRLRDVSYVRWLAGNGLDVGAGDDPLSRWRPLFPLMGDCRSWDKPDGDAQTLPGIAADSLDFLHSSHCLEHLPQPKEALRRWCEVVRPGGHVIVVVPDFELYEKRRWTSQFNGDHRHNFSIYDPEPANADAINILDLIVSLSDIAIPLKIELLAGTHLPDEQGDQTLNCVSECAIEFVLRRR